MGGDGLEPPTPWV